MRDSLKRQLNDAEDRHSHNLTVPKPGGTSLADFQNKSKGVSHSKNNNDGIFKSPIMSQAKSHLYV